MMNVRPQRQPSVAAEPAPCPACGARLNGRAGCQAAFDALGAAAWTSPARGAVHNLLVDAYCMQHPEDYCRSAKSYAAHLTGLCCGLEASGDAARYWAVARWLDGSRDLTKPALAAVGARGRVTVADVVDCAEDAQYAAAVRAWASAVWQAYGVQHQLARDWLRMAAAAAPRDARPGSGARR
jgi:hypothetical protein